MRLFNCIKLRFNSPLHIGRGISDNYDRSEALLHSDTLSAAIASARVELFGEHKIKDFIEDLRISSAFPFYNDRYFFMKPMLKMNVSIDGKEEFELGKILKKIQFIEKPLFETLLNGGKLVISEKQISADQSFIWSETPLIENILKTHVQQRVQIPRNIEGENNSLPYNVERIFFNDNCGLFFLIETKKENTLKETLSALKLLEDNGIGTDRSVGNGFFESEITELSLSLPEKSNFVMNLSMFCPEKEEIPAFQNSDSAYLLKKRGGYIAGAKKEQFRHLRKKSIYMFTEGSIFKANQLKGKILNLRPDWEDDSLHPVYRSGIPLYLPVNLKTVNK